MGFQFSLRTLFSAFVVVAFAIGWYSEHQSRLVLVESNKKIRQTITSLQSSLALRGRETRTPSHEKVAGYHRYRETHLQLAEILLASSSPEVSSQLIRDACGSSLDLCDTFYTDDALSKYPVAIDSPLRFVHLANSDVSAGGLKHLYQHGSSIQYIDLSDCERIGDGIADLLTDFPTLSRLILIRTHVSEPVIEEMRAAFPKVTILY